MFKNKYRPFHRKKNLSTLLHLLCRKRSFVMNSEHLLSHSISKVTHFTRTWKKRNCRWQTVWKKPKRSLQQQRYWDRMCINENIFHYISFSCLFRFFFFHLPFICVSVFIDIDISLRLCATLEATKLISEQQQVMLKWVWIHYHHFTFN